MNQKIEAIIFDADGTLLDSREMLFKSFEHTLAVHGYPVPTRAEIGKHAGPGLVECYRLMVPDGDHEMLCQTHHAFQQTLIDVVEGYEGVQDVLRTIKDAGIKIGICTNRGGGVIDMLARAGIQEYCEVIMHIDVMEKPKPDPEGILKALEILQAAPAHAAMIGDMTVDILAGKSAAVALTIGITHGLETRESLEAVGADHIVDHLSDIPALILQ